MLAAAGNDSQAAREALSSLCQTYYLLTGRPPLDTPDFREVVSKGRVRDAAIAACAAA